MIRQMVIEGMSKLHTVGRTSREDHVALRRENSVVKESNSSQMVRVRLATRPKRPGQCNHVEETYKQSTDKF